VSSPEDHEEKVAIPRGTFLLLLLFLIVMAGLWANVYLRVVWRA